MKLRRLLLLAALLGSSLRAAEAVSIAAASDLVFCLEVLNTEFAKTEPAVALKVSTGSSGNFFSQIQNGAPFDVFLSADLRYPRELIAAKNAEENSLTLYAIGRIVLWTTRADLDISDPAKAVRDPRLQKLAIANPAHAPYGRAAQQALEKLGVWTVAQPKLVMGENIAQTAQFVQTGNVDAGIVALSLLLAPTLKGVGRWTPLPLSLYEPLEQGAVLTRNGSVNPAAKRYLAFLRTPTARTIFDRFGFLLPASP